MTLSATVAGLEGTGLVLQYNDQATIDVTSNGQVILASDLVSGSAYSVKVLTQPSDPGQSCVVSNDTGTATSNVDNVTVTCTTTEIKAYRIGGVVSGLSGSGLVLQNNGGDDLFIAENGAFTFQTSVADGASYAVSVSVQPENPEQNCAVSNANGTAQGAGIDNVQVACTTRTIYQLVEVSGTTGAPGSSGELLAACPVDKPVVGGGFSASGTDRVWNVLFSAPSEIATEAAGTRAWRVRFTSLIEGQLVKAYAVCASLPGSSQPTVFTSDGLSNDGVIAPASVAVQCPSAQKILSGGFGSSGPLTNVQFFESHPAGSDFRFIDNTGWAVGIFQDQDGPWFSRLICWGRPLDFVQPLVEQFSVTGPAGTVAQLTAQCPSGMRVLSGGYRVVSSVGAELLWRVTSSRPGLATDVESGPAGDDGWTISYVSGGEGVSISAVAACAPI
ncbi:hypothetical protein [Rubrivivax albus]|uniref:Uncharacterized protein n=1 Tax=Rubrivivax albus TaxID=2499835 RepID=A0A437JMS5_9BURK|nr:hypothetical protein [Rubrivivax albus]RVT48116.1 hypothetical protein ENE75_23295 [Rubrivivax albus]